MQNIAYLFFQRTHHLISHFVGVRILFGKICRATVKKFKQMQFLNDHVEIIEHIFRTDAAGNIISQYMQHLIFVNADKAFNNHFFAFVMVVQVTRTDIQFHGNIYTGYAVFAMLIEQ